MIDKADGEKSMNIVSFVILHYKDAEVTDACIQSILAMEQQERIRIVVVDNDIEEKDEKRRALAECYMRIPGSRCFRFMKTADFPMRTIRAILMPERF